MKKITILLFLILSMSVFGQVKIGNNPSQIDQYSLLELESSNKVFVLSRMSTTEMNAVEPLQGAMVYNLDDKCIYVFQGTSWKSLCNSGSDNQQLSFDNVTNIISLENGGEIDLTSVIVGAKGDKGDQGDVGPQGSAGADGKDGADSTVAGPQGLKGDKGDTGAAGNDGAVGPQGPQGNDGATGPAGADGAQGPQGDIGLTGATGPQGNDGAQGPAGPQGSQGNDGPAGPQGDTGLTGATGPLGPQGNDGAAGPQGPAGPAGADGVGIAQTLSFSGSTLSISSGNSITIPIETLSTISNTVAGHKIGDYKNEGGATVQINETITALSQNSTTGVITYTNENGSSLNTANVVSSNTNNGISAGSDGGAYFRSPIRAMGKINGAGTALKIKGATVSYISQGIYLVSFLSPMPDSNYIVQLTVVKPSGPNLVIAIVTQTTLGFTVNINSAKTNGWYADAPWFFTVQDF